MRAEMEVYPSDGFAWTSPSMLSTAPAESIRESVVLPAVLAAKVTPSAKAGRESRRIVHRSGGIRRWGGTIGQTL
jgi:hypothetical protein